MSEIEREPSTEEHEPREPAMPPSSDRSKDSATPLLPAVEAREFDERWQGVQASFVDHPREAVKDADGLVADLMERLASQFSDTREDLERQWEHSDDVSTEDLRLALTRYRSFFERLLAT